RWCSSPEWASHTSNRVSPASSARAAWTRMAWTRPTLVTPPSSSVLVMMASYSETNWVGSMSGWRLARVFRTRSKLAITVPCSGSATVSPPTSSRPRSVLARGERLEHLHEFVVGKGGALLDHPDLGRVPVGPTHLQLAGHGVGLNPHGREPARR